MGKTLIAGNWKMNKTPGEAMVLATALLGIVAAAKVDVVICPPTLALQTVCNSVQGSNIGVGAQNVYWQGQGAFTGETSCDMLREIGCSHVICGHSERRSLFGETDAEVAKKAAAVTAAGMIPIVCVGEKLSERQAGAYLEVVGKQLQASLGGWNGITRLVVAYEPIWAIGTGQVATPENAEEVCAFIRTTLAAMYTAQSAESVSILYGGSVTEKSIASLIKCPNIDGALVGGASLRAAEFAAIVQAAGLNEA